MPSKIFHSHSCVQHKPHVSPFFETAREKLPDLLRCAFATTRRKNTSLNKMSFPFPDDRIALGRLDWCRAGKADDYSGLSCILRARMCAAHIQATKNPDWGTMAKPALSELLSVAKVKSWTPCPQGDVSGTCGMLLTDRYGPPLWEAFGLQREQALYEAINNGHQPEPPPQEAKQLPVCAYHPTDVYRASEKS